MPHISWLPSKFFKVRFGNFATKETARQKAESLKDAKVIKEFYIVQPEEYSIAVSRTKKNGTEYLRDSLVKTAKDFIGVPYLWGGQSVDDGFDCSGLTMTVYQLNGMNLPRHSMRQFDAGTSISKDELRKGDLVFFAKKRNKPCFARGNLYRKRQIHSRFIAGEKDSY